MSDATLVSPEESVIQPEPVTPHDVNSLISMRDLWKTYQMGAEQVHALHGVSFDVMKGEYIAIIGPSGSGKSSLLYLLGLLDLPTSGDVLIDGRSTTAMTITGWSCPWLSPGCTLKARPPSPAPIHSTTHSLDSPRLVRCSAQT